MTGRVWNHALFIFSNKIKKRVKDYEKDKKRKKNFRKQFWKF